jgi:hypothetical protein
MPRDPWQPLALDVAGPLRDAPRDVAERAFAALMAARADRCRALAALVAADGVSLDGDDAAAALGAWLLADAHAAGPDALAGPRLPGLAVDASLWLGERIIAGAAAAGGALRWELYTGVKKSTGYQRAVLTGFRRVDDPRYYVDVAHFVSSWLELCARRRPARADFLATVERTTLADA